MPNWCNTIVIISHNDTNKTKELYDKLKEWTSKDYHENDFGHEWLGNVALGSGIATWDKNKGAVTDTGKIVNCRGAIRLLDFEDGNIHISQDDAWSPNVYLYKMICDKYLPDAEILFSADEPGCEVYETNDPAVEGSYVIDVYYKRPDEFKDEDTMYEAEESDVVEFCQRALKTDETDITKLLDAMKNVDWCSIHKWKHQEIEDYC